MTNLFNSFMSGYHEYATRVARRKARKILLNQNDRLLADAGFSRDLLEQGVAAWPWRQTAVADYRPMALSPTAKVDAAAGQLRNHSQAEAADTGRFRAGVAGSARNAVEEERDLKAA